jgi:hypothetical protein
VGNGSGQRQWPAVKECFAVEPSVLHRIMAMPVQSGFRKGAKSRMVKMISMVSRECSHDDMPATCARTAAQLALCRRNYSVFARLDFLALDVARDAAAKLIEWPLWYRRGESRVNL